ncbi:MAG: M23 family metallopeptidase [Gammaproteobacteria bacterium]|nr:M23 family metallopeptidase [Gammaproteobacteria bacterium]
MTAAFATAQEPPITILRGQWRQGELLLGHAPPGTHIEFDGHGVGLTPYGTFTIGLDRDEKSPAVLQVTAAGGEQRTLRYPVAPGNWKIQAINGLPEAEVNPPPAMLARIRREAQEIRAARSVASPAIGFTEHFIWPVVGEISSVFGSQRVLNGQPRQPHYGVDIAVPSGTPVKAPAAGMVRLVAHDFYFTGGTLMIDHGHGVQSVFAHLSRILVAAGERVGQGQVVALTGASGRATGPNLHWGVSWFDNHVDPAALAGPMPDRSPDTH